MRTQTASCDLGCLTEAIAHVQRARLISEDGEELTEGLARLDFHPPLSVALVNLEPVAPLVLAIVRGRREFDLELEEGITLRVRVLGAVALIAHRQLCFLRVLSSQMLCYCIGQAWNDLRN